MDLEDKPSVPFEKRRPDDEFFDLQSIVPLKVVDVLPDCSIQILVIEEGTGACVDPEDTVFYKHETRFDNGQLVDLQETRKIPEKFPMNDE